jgi:hypothetical protein
MIQSKHAIVHPCNSKLTILLLKCTRAMTVILLIKNSVFTSSFLKKIVCQIDVNCYLTYRATNATHVSLAKI